MRPAETTTPTCDEEKSFRTMGLPASDLDIVKVLRGRMRGVGENDRVQRLRAPGARQQQRGFRRVKDSKRMRLASDRVNGAPAQSVICMPWPAAAIKRTPSKETWLGSDSDWLRVIATGQIMVSSASDNTT